MLNPWKKNYTNLDRILKSRDITLLTKIRIVRALIFLVFRNGRESWTIKKAEWWIDAFHLWCWRRLFRVPWTASRSNQSFLKEINPEYSLEGQMWKLKLQYFGHLMQRTDSLEKTLMLGKIFNLPQEDWSPGEENDRRWDEWMASPIRWTWVWVISGSWWWTGKPAAVHEVTKSRTWLSDWTEVN